MKHGIIYQYTNTLNGLIYVGQTMHPAKRRRAYVGELASTRPNPRCIIQAMRQVGLKAFTYQILAEATTADDLNRLEIHYIAMLQANDPRYGYNRTSGGQCGPVGRTVSAETKAKLSLANRGKILSAETKAKIAQTIRDRYRGDPTCHPSYGRTFSAEHRAKISQANRGRTLSAETRAKMSLSGRGHAVSEETKAKISQANRGKVRTKEDFDHG